MNLQYLNAFYVTVQANSISKAAKLLHLTQPGLSMQIQSLENDLKAQLLIRSNKGVKLTEEGQIVFDYASKILSLQGNIERDLLHMKHGQLPLLIGSCKSIGEYALPCSVYIFKQANPDLDVSLQVFNSKEVVDQLLDNSISLGFIHEQPTHEDLVTLPITTEPLPLVASEITDDMTLTLDELAHQPLILREEHSGTRMAVVKALKSHQLQSMDLNVIFELNSIEAIKSSVLSGKGMAFIPEISIRRELRDGTLKRVNIKDLSISTTFYIAYRKGHQLTQSEQEFIDLVTSTDKGFC